MDVSKLQFFSQLNYMKRSKFVNSSNVTLPSAGNSVSVDINHLLNYIPFFIAGVEVDNDGIVWSNNKVHAFTESSQASSDTPVYFEYWSTANVMTIDIINGIGSGAQSGLRRVYWGVYVDYKV